MKRLLDDVCAKFTIPQDLRDKGIYPYYKPVATGQNPVVTMADGKKVLMFGSNSYLGLSDDPRLKEAAMAAVKKYGTSCSGSRFLNGTLDLHEKLEAKLAEFTGKEAAVTFSTGFQVNLGVVSCLGVRGSYILLDETDHACIIDGARLSFGTVYKFRHNDMESLEHKLKVCAPDAMKLIVVDGVYSMLGDLCKLPEICDLCEKYGASVMVDDAHGMGVFGENGSGTASHFGLTDRVDLIMSTFSKSFGSLGGFIAGNKGVIDYIRNTARSLMFSASMTPATVAAALKALEIMKEEPQRREHLWELARYAWKRFRENGFDINATDSPIIPLMVRDSEKAMRAVIEAYNQGLFITPVVAPAVAEKDALIRFALMATHSFDQVDEAVDKLTRIFKHFEIIE